MPRSQRLTALTIALAVTAAAAPCAAVHADAGSDAAKSIQAQYNKRDTALALFDIEGYMAIYNVNYRNMTRAQAKPDRQRLALIASLQRADKIARQETVQSVTLTPDGATAIVSSVTHIYGRDLKTKAPFAHVLRETDRAFWVSTKRGWRMKQERRLGDGGTSSDTVTHYQVALPSSKPTAAAAP